jgi:hypothetical protein
VLLAVNELFTDAGTAVGLLSARDMDLFLEASLFSGRRKLGLDLERRVLTFPSGELRELDLNLFVGMGLGGGLRLPV